MWKARHIIWGEAISSTIQQCDRPGPLKQAYGKSKISLHETGQHCTCSACVKILSRTKALFPTSTHHESKLRSAPLRNARPSWWAGLRRSLCSLLETCTVAVGGPPPLIMFTVRNIMHGSTAREGMFMLTPSHAACVVRTKTNPVSCALLCSSRNQ